ncbi:MAG: DUF4040 domain-containing protein [Gemmatimonadetes bacterium]|nr:DUF4040 domain-containing protein [Gemmatimonadota bacterium]
MEFLIDIAVLLLLAFTAIAITRLRNLFAAVMLAGLYSLLSACWMVALDAVDVAFTEAAVGAGVSTVLMLMTLAVTARREKAPKFSFSAFLVVVVTGGFLIYGTFDMPAWGDPDAPVHQHVAPRYLNESYEEVGVPNVVTSVLASYRGYDTLGETVVIFTAGLGVMLLLRKRKKEDEL